MAQDQIDFTFEVDWDFDTSYTDESSRVISISGAMSMNSPGSTTTSGRGIMSNMSVQLDNTDGRYSPLNSTGALYSVIRDGQAYHAPCRLLVTTDGSTPTTADAQFIGVIKLPVENGITQRQPGIVTLECVSREDLIMHQFASTDLSDFKSIFDDGYDESEIIDLFLDSISSVVDGTDYVSQADAGSPKTLDRGLFVVPWAWMDDESPIEDIWQVAAACGGRFYAAPHDGKFYYNNAVSVLTSSRSTSSQETFDESNLKSFTATYNDRDMYSSVVVEYAGREIGKTEVLWQPEEDVIVPANSSLDYSAMLQQPAYEITTIGYTATTGGGVDISDDVSISHSEKAQRIEMTITNANVTYAALMRQFSISGRPVSGRPAAQEKRTSAADGTNGDWWSGRGARTRRVSGNPYLQTQAQASMLASFILNRQEYPGLRYRGQALGAVDRRLGDRVTFDFDGVMDSSRTGIITSIRFRLANASYTHTIEAVDTENLYPHIDGTYGYFVLGTNKLGTSDPDRARLFF